MWLASIATSCRRFRLRACYHGQVSRRPARKSRASKLRLLPHRLAYRVNLFGGSFPFGRLFFVSYPLLGRKPKGGTAQCLPGSPRYSNEMTYPRSTFSRILIGSYTHTRFSMKSSAKTAAIPVHLLRSGWDHDLDLVSPVSRVPSINLSLFKKTGSTCSAPSPSPTEDGFTQPTVHYLSSGAARQLRPPPVINSQSHTSFASPPLSSRPPEGSLTVPKAPFDVESIVSASPTGSIFSADTWPKPPLTVPPHESHPVLAATVDPSRPSSPLSVRSSLGSTIVDALGAIPAHLRDVPFNVYGPGVAAVPISRPPRNLTEHRSPSRKASRKDAIYMTVVHETDSDIGP